MCPHLYMKTHRMCLRNWHTSSCDVWPLIQIQVFHQSCFLSKEILERMSSRAGAGVIGLSHETHSTFQKTHFLMTHCLNTKTFGLTHSFSEWGNGSMH